MAVNERAAPPRPGFGRQRAAAPRRPSGSPLTPSAPQPPDEEAEPSDGTQAIRRAALILQRIARVTGDGTPNLTEIARSVGLARSTTHRILKSLTDVGLAAYDPVARRYGIGRLGYELGLAVTEDVLALAPWRAAVDRIALRSGATTYLMRRSGIEAVCLHKADGTSPIRAIPVEVGQRRHLGIGAGSTALLAALDETSAEHVLKAIAPSLASFAALDVDAVREAVRHARETGFAVSQGRAYPGIFGLGRAVPGPEGFNDLAVSIAVHESIANETQVRLWRKLIREELTASGEASSSDQDSGA